ncbi:hypothetical protein IWX48DRAFT_680310, partial [Phyllosticta citricarpa]
MNICASIGRELTGGRVDKFPWRIGGFNRHVSSDRFPSVVLGGRLRSGTGGRASARGGTSRTRGDDGKLASQVAEVESVLDLLRRRNVLLLLRLLWRLVPPLALEIHIPHHDLQALHLQVHRDLGTRLVFSATTGLSFGLLGLLGCLRVDVHCRVGATLALVRSRGFGDALVVFFQLADHRVQVDRQDFSCKADSGFVARVSLPALDLIAQELPRLLDFDAQGGELLQLVGKFFRVAVFRQDHGVGLVDASFCSSVGCVGHAGHLTRLDLVVDQTARAVLHEVHQGALAGLAGLSCRSGERHFAGLEAEVEVEGGWRFGSATH